MNIKERIMADVKEAMRSKEQDKLTTLRTIHSSIKNREIEVRPKEVDEQEVMALLKKLIKQRQDSVEQFEKAGRTDLSEKEKQEILLIETYLPQAMGREQIEGLVTLVMSELGANSIKQMGIVIKEVAARSAGAADNRIISEIVKSKLN
jgi:uncharacterized protein